jgi:hypothetical protein
LVKADNRLQFFGGVMEAWEVDVTCPLCGATVRGNKLQKHRNRKHADVPVDAFEAAIVASAGRDVSTISTKRAAKTSADAAATKALMKARKEGHGFTGVVSGGAFGLGKRK